MACSSGGPCGRLEELYEAPAAKYEVALERRVTSVSLQVCLDCGKVQIGYYALRKINEVYELMEKGEWQT